MPTVAYHKVNEQLYIYQAELNFGDMEVTVTTLDGDIDYLHAVETSTLPLVRELLKITDFGFVN